MVELDWLMMNYEVSRNQTKPLTVLYDKLGSVEDEDGCDLTEKYPNLSLHQVKPKYPYGTHHSKVMVRISQDLFLSTWLGTHPSTMSTRHPGYSRGPSRFLPVAIEGMSFSKGLFLKE